jgi:hypothetical protein
MGRCISTWMQSVDEAAQGHDFDASLEIRIITVTAGNISRRALPHSGYNNWFPKMHDRFYGKGRLETVLSGSILPNTVPPTRITVLNGTPR